MQLYAERILPMLDRLFDYGLFVCFDMDLTNFMYF